MMAETVKEGDDRKAKFVSGQQINIAIASFFCKTKINQN